jgi:hypothetical protein
MESMAHVARVKDGRLVLDEPTDLPEGSTLELFEADDRREDELDEEELRLLAEEIAKSRADIAAGRTVTKEELIRQLRSNR